MFVTTMVMAAAGSYPRSATTFTGSRNHLHTVTVPCRRLNVIRGAHMKILVVTGEPLAAFELTSVLENAGHEVVGPAHSMPVALSMVQDEPVDLALLAVDQGTPGDRAELAHALQEQQGTVSALVGEAQDYAGGTEQGVTKVMSQPESCDEARSVVEVISMVLASERPARILQPLIP